MTPRADAHMHFFEGGYRGPSFISRPGVKIDEAACYASLAAEYHVTAALVVGYAAEPWCKDNNAYIAALAPSRPWMRPVAFVKMDQPLSVDRLQELRAQRFVGLSFYIFDETALTWLAQAPDSVWAWLEENRWLLSVNSRGKNWAAFLPILERHRGLRLLISHLGLPPRAREAPSRAETARAMEEVLRLAPFPGVRVKLSGFYALTEPGYGYPHPAAWPYVEALLAKFTSQRLLWASDFSPCLDWLSFPQTFGLFEHMPFLSESDRARIVHGNLSGLFEEVDSCGDGKA